MNIILRYFDLGIVYFLLSLAFFINYSRLKFIDLSTGALFVISGIFYYIWINFSIPLCLFPIFLIFLAISVSMITYTFTSIGIDKYFSGIISFAFLLMCISSLAFVPELLNSFSNDIFPKIFEVDIISISFSVLIFIAIAFFFFLSKATCLQNNKFLIRISTSNILVAFSGFLYFLFEDPDTNSQISSLWGNYLAFPFLGALLVLFISKIFLGSFNGVKTIFLLFFTSSFLIAFAFGIFEIAMRQYFYYDYFSFLFYANKNIIFNIIILFLVTVYLKLFYGKNCFLLENDNCIEEKEKEEEVVVDPKLIDIIKTQYI